MRIIAGLQKGRRLVGPPGAGLRPTADRVREALFSILGEQVRGARVLDLFAGTGAVGIEALSRGATHVTFVESQPAALRVLRANLARCGAATQALVRGCTVSAFLRTARHRVAPYDLVFADPPYAAEAAAKVLRALDQADILPPDALVVLEHATRQVPPPRIGRLAHGRDYRYGDTTLSLYRSTPEAVVRA